MHNSQLNGHQQAALTDSQMAPKESHGKMYEHGYTSSQIDPLRAIWRRLWLIALVTIVLVGLAALFSLLQTPVYESSIMILIKHERSQNISPDLGNEFDGLQQVTATMAEAISSRPVAQSVIQRLDLQMSPQTFLQHLNVEQVGTTQFIDVSYEDTDPERAQRIASTIGDVFSEQSSVINPSADKITATVYEQAMVPTSPVSPNPARNILLALILGLFLGVGLAMFLDYLDNARKMATEEETTPPQPRQTAIEGERQP